MKQQCRYRGEVGSCVSRLVCGLVAWGLVVGLAGPALALVVKGSPSTTAAAPADDPGWANVTNVGSNFTYLGDGWVLTARHAGISSVHLDSGTFQAISGQDFIVHNPNLEEQGFTGVTEQTDLRLFRIDGDPGLPDVSIAQQSPSSNSEVVMITNGRSREAVQTRWDVDESSSDWEWTETTTGNGDYRGYKTVHPVDDTKRWGKNRLANPNNYENDGAFSHILSSTTGVLPLKTADGVTRHVLSLVTAFDESGLANEAQAVPNDSGGAVFHKRGGEWELAGIINATFLYPNQPASKDPDIKTAVYGDATTMADLSYYNQPYYRSICDIMQTCGNYSTMGDVNLDGEISGDGTGPAGVDDVSAFVEGWQYSTGTGRGDYLSWTHGDLNLDGLTDAQDFLLLRGALLTSGNSGGGLASLSSLLGGAGVGVPEPAAGMLALMAASLLAIGRRRRGRPAC